MFDDLAHGKISFDCIEQRLPAYTLHCADVVVGVSNDMNELKLNSFKLLLHGFEKAGVSAHAGEAGGVADDLQLFESTLPLVGNVIGMGAPFSAYGCHLARVFQKNKECLSRAKAMSKVPKRADLACDDHVWMSIQ